MAQEAEDTHEEVPQVPSCAEGGGSRGMEEPALRASHQLPTGARIGLPRAAGSWPAEAFAQMWN